MLAPSPILATDMRGLPEASSRSLYMSANSKGSGETALMRSSPEPAGRLCDTDAHALAYPRKRAVHCCNG